MMLSQAERSLSSGETVSIQSVIPQIQWLQDQTNSMKMLFRFIVGKLEGDLISQILGEIAELLVEHAVDSDSGEALPIIFLKKYMQDLKTEIQTSSQTEQHSQNYKRVDTDFSIRAMKYINTDTDCERIKPCFERIQTETAFNALRVEEISRNLPAVTQLIQKMKKLILIELQSTNASVFSRNHLQEFSEVLSFFTSLVTDSRWQTGCWPCPQHPGKVTFNSEKIMCTWSDRK